MDNFTIVRPEHLNHHGYLFGGAMLRWVDEYAWIAAALDFPGCSLVTRALDNIVFRRRVVSGAILRFNSVPVRQGTSSVTYRVCVFADEPGATVEIEIFDTTITFVRVDRDGKKIALPRKERLRSLPAGATWAYGPEPER
jgi:acyl-CoA hydrolase